MDIHMTHRNRKGRLAGSGVAAQLHRLGEGDLIYLLLLVIPAPGVTPPGITTISSVSSPSVAHAVAARPSVMTRANSKANKVFCFFSCVLSPLFVAIFPAHTAPSEQSQGHHRDPKDHRQPFPAFTHGVVSFPCSHTRITPTGDRNKVPCPALSEWADRSRAVPCRWPDR